MRLLFLFLSFTTITFCQIDNILNNIKTDSLMHVVKELTGALPVEKNGKTDTLKTRIYLSTYNRLAGDYIKSKFESMEIETEVQHFHSYSPAGVTVDFTSAAYNELTKTIWTSTSWGELFRSAQFPPVFKSLNISGNPDSDRLDWIVFDGREKIYAMGKNGSFTYSTDEGNSWKKISTKISNVRKLMLTPGGLITAAKNGTIWKSSNDGQTWSQIIINSSFEISDAYFDNNKLFAAGKDIQTGKGLLYFSNDSGENWQPFNFDFVNPLVHLVSDNSYIWTADDNGRIFRSSNYGEQWELTFSPGSTFKVNKMQFLGDNGWMLSTNDFYKSTDRGITWNYLTNIDTPSTVSNFLFIDSAKGILTGMEYSGVVTTDGGSEWLDETIPLSKVIVATIPGTTEPEKCIVLTAHYDCVINSLGDFTGWIIAPGADDDASGTSALIELGRVLKEFPLKYSVKFGFVPDEEFGSKGSRILAQTAKTDSVLFVLDLDMIGYDYHYPDNLVIIINKNDVARRIFFNSYYFLSEAGLTLKPFPWYNSNPANTAGFTDNYPILGFMDGGGFGTKVQPNYHKLTDIWSTLNPDYLTSVTKAAAIVVYNFSTGEILNAEENENVVYTYNLFSSYPNPFNSQCTIIYSIPFKSFVKLRVYDILGNEIAVLVNNNMNGGLHKVQFRADNLTSGIYFYKLESGEFTESRKMIYLK